MSEKESLSQSESDLWLFVLKVVLVGVVLVGGYMLFLLAPIISILLFSGFLTILFSPVLDRLARYRVPDAVGVLVIYFGLAAFLLLAFFAIVPIFVHQVSVLFSELSSLFSSFESAYRSGGLSELGLPAWLSGHLSSVDLSSLFEYVRSHASAIAATAADATRSIATSSVGIIASVSSGIFQASMILVCTFLMSLERKKIKTLIYAALPSRWTEYLASRESQIESTLLWWLRGQMLLAVSIFALTFAGLFSLRLFGVHIEGILTLALIAGLMEFIPYIGPLLALLPALAIAAGMWVTPIVSVLVLYIVIQQLENNILVPLVMSRTLDISPLLVFVFMLALSSLLGLVGILIAIPVAAIVRMFVIDWLDRRNGAKVSIRTQKPKKS